MTNMLDGLIGGIREVLENGRPIPFKRAINFVGMRVVQGADWLSVELASLLGSPLSRTGDPLPGQVIAFDGNAWTNTDPAGGGTEDHQALVNRDASECHPASAIVDTVDYGGSVHVPLQFTLDTLRSQVSTIPTSHAQLSDRSEAGSHPASAIEAIELVGNEQQITNVQMILYSLKNRIEYLESLLYPAITISLQSPGPVEEGNIFLINTVSTRVIMWKMQYKGSDTVTEWSEIGSGQQLKDPHDEVFGWMPWQEQYIDLRIIATGAFNTVISNELRVYRA